MHILALYFAHRPVVTWEVVIRLASADCREISETRGREMTSTMTNSSNVRARGEAARCGIEEHQSASSCRKLNGLLVHTISSDDESRF